MILIYIVGKGCKIMEELKKLLIHVPDSYYDFVTGMMAEAKDSDNIREGLLDYLKSHPSASTSDVIYFVSKDLGLANSSKIEISA